MPSSSRSVSQLNPYCYERIEVVLKIIQTADENVTCFSVSQVTRPARTRRDLT